ncbi:hypothetical protein CEXT_204821 [Caerostris extrusa]|uniref:Uncharacterized protein n=1 Tax=Caerostris extrusa TaxID=172846 RepID=A0AAV4VLF7_CAEEX|nr:hypothetical protein CEXT_204821 [Caerostris extrusa]
MAEGRLSEGQWADRDRVGMGTERIYNCDETEKEVDGDLSREFMMSDLVVTKRQRFVVIKKLKNDLKSLLPLFLQIIHQRKLGSEEIAYIRCRDLFEDEIEFPNSFRS